MFAEPNAERNRTKQNDSERNKTTRLRRPFSVAFYGSIRDVVAVHGHGGRTRRSITIW
jgi:hypothetical protein